MFNYNTTSKQQECASFSYLCIWNKWTCGSVAFRHVAFKKRTLLKPYKLEDSQPLINLPNSPMLSTVILYFVVIKNLWD